MPFASCENYQHIAKMNKKDSQNRFTSGFSIFRLTSFGVYSQHVKAQSNFPNHYRRTNSEKGKNNGFIKTKSIQCFSSNILPISN